MGRSNARMRSKSATNQVHELQCRLRIVTRTVKENYAQHLPEIITSNSTLSLLRPPNVIYLARVTALILHQSLTTIAQ